MQVDVVTKKPGMAGMNLFFLLFCVVNIALSIILIAKVNSQGSQVNELQTNLQTNLEFILNTDVNALTQNITALNTSFSTLYNQVNTQYNSTVQSMTNTYNWIASNITQFNDTISKVNSNISSLNNSFTSLNTDAYINITYSNATEYINSTNNTNNITQTQINTTNSTITSQLQELAYSQAGIEMVNNLVAELSSIQPNISNLSTILTGFQTNLTGINSTLAVLNGNFSILQSNLTDYLNFQSFFTGDITNLNISYSYNSSQGPITNNSVIINQTKTYPFNVTLSCNINGFMNASILEVQYDGNSTNIIGSFFTINGNTSYPVTTELFFATYNSNPGEGVNGFYVTSTSTSVTIPYPTSVSQIVIEAGFESANYTFSTNEYIFSIPYNITAYELDISCIASL